MKKGDKVWSDFGEIVAVAMGMGYDEQTAEIIAVELARSASLMEVTMTMFKTRKEEARSRGVAWHRVTKEEKAIIRDAARREGGRKVEVGLRIQLDATEHNPQMNIALLNADADMDQTDLYDTWEWSWFCKGFELAEHGKAVVDFYVYSTGDHGELEGNVTAYWEHDKLVKVRGTMGNIYWQAGAK